MREEMKNCPFCGKEPKVYKINGRNFFGCGRHECYTSGYDGIVTKSIWNARPIEDALRADRDEAREMVERLIEAGKPVVYDYIQLYGWTTEKSELWESLVAEWYGARQ